jgi:acyl-CoA thioester hydrolase
VEHISKMTVRFCETDALGHVSNISYYIYLEQARTEFFKAIGRNMNAADWHFIIASCGCQFKKQAYFDQSLVVKTTVSKIGKSSVHFFQIIADEQTGQEIAIGDSVIVHFNFQTQKSEPLPEFLREKFEGYQVNEAEKISRQSQTIK